MSWINKTIDQWSDSQRKEVVKKESVAHDTLRRRTAQKGWRLGLLCYTLWAKVGKKEQKIIIDFVKAWMDKDLRESLKLFEESMNKQHYEAQNVSKVQTSLFASMPDEFSKEDVITQCVKFRIKTKVRQIIHLWKRENLIEKIDTNRWKKVAKQ